MMKHLFTFLISMGLWAQPALVTVNCRESVAFQTTAETIAVIHDATGPGWTISADFSQLVPPASMDALNLPAA